jgi:DNA polymerase-3 subunit delta
LNLATLRKEIAAGSIRPAYLVVGQEPLLRDDAVGILREAALAPGTEDFNFDRLDGATARPADLLDAVATLPVMADRRLVILRDPEAARGSAKALTEAIAEIVPGLASRADLVFVVVAEKADRRSRWTRSFCDPAADVQCDPPKRGRELIAFLRDEAKRQGVTLESASAELLAERVGPQLLMLRGEIAKAALLAGIGAPILPEHVAAGTCDLAEESIWDLTDAIGEGRGADALTSLSKILAAGSAPPQVLGALASHFRKLLRLRTGGRASGPPFAVQKLERQSGRFTARRLRGCLRAIHETDVALKGGGVLGPGMAIERLVIGLAA